jgi:hypothetical protein
VITKSEDYDYGRHSFISVAKSQNGRSGSRGGLIDYVDTSLKENKRDIQETNLRTLVTKEDLAKTKEELKGDISKTREELKTDLAKTKEELKTDIAKTREDLKDVKSETIRWMFAFFVTMMLTILGLYLKH